MDSNNFTAKELCELAKAGELTTDEIIRKLNREAKVRAGVGQKKLMYGFKSSAVSEDALKAVKAHFESRGFKFSSERDSAIVSVCLDFDVC